MRTVIRKFRSLFFATCALLGAASPAFAQDLTSIIDSTVNVYNQAIDDEEAGRYGQACIGYRDAAERFESAIYSLVGQPMQTEEERENIKAYADHVQGEVDDAKAGASRVCGK